MANYYWHRFSASESFTRIQRGENPWVAFGDFLDDWRRTRPEDRAALVEQAPEKFTTEDEQRWAALFAATVEFLCKEEQLPVPRWVTSPQFSLQKAWYPEARTANLRRLQEETTPEPFARRNIFSGDRLLQRV
ncbi:MAG: hypothetical protein IMW89_12845 [Ktedonobacteraceae bacterium]|nr:hypothetical protein [Ktedonobacteraceae bacterium]